MKTIYSILYVNLNTSLSERVSIGVLVSNGLKHYFKYSTEKLSAFKSILDNERYTLVKNYLKSLEKEIGFKETSISKQLLAKKDFHNDWVNESYLTYLSKYSNNIVQFSLPKTIDIELKGDTFKKIFEKYIFKYSEEIDVAPLFKYLEKTDVAPLFNVHSIVKKQLFPKIKNNVNIEKSLTSDDFENLFVPIEIGFIGANGSAVAGQTIDFEKKYYYLENDVTRFVSLTKAIDLEGNTQGKYYILGREPQKKADKNHLLWELIRDTAFLEFVDIGEVGIIEEYIEKNNVKPFFE